MAGDITPYPSLITSQHTERLDYMAVITALVQPAADAIAVLQSMPAKFDLDAAVGTQLDIVGEWIGQSRYLTVPLTDVYFSFDIAGLGFDQGTWLGPFDPVTGLIALPDDAYRTLLRARIANNQWAGNVPDAYQFLDDVFPDNVVFIQDNSDMSMYVGVVGAAALDAVSYALLTGGYLDVKPSGVRIAGYVTPSVEGEPIFGFDVQNDLISGFDTGAFPTVTGGN
jgi:hypothetical protein